MLDVTTVMVASLLGDHEADAVVRLPSGLL